MIPDRTELAWSYEPSDFFEVPYEHQEADFCLTAGDGSIVARLSTPQDPIPSALRARIRNLVDNLLLVRQLHDHRHFESQGPNVRQFEGELKHVYEEVTGSFTIGAGMQIDFIHQNAAGNVIRDSRAERIAAHTVDLDRMSVALARSPELRSMATSYRRSVDDPGNELVHLYEIYDTVMTHFGGKGAAVKALSVSEKRFRRLGRLSCREPLEQGRHRGKHPTSRRPATPTELDEARGIAMQVIKAFAQRV
jgi:hypothetical protein